MSFRRRRSRPDRGPFFGHVGGPLVAGALAIPIELGCGDSGTPPRVGDLGRGPGSDSQVALVDDERVALESVERIASAQQVSLDEALRRAIFDALCAREARARDLDRRSSFEIATHLARGVLDDELQRAREQGPPTAEELRAYRAEHRLEVARPEVVVVVHGLVSLSAEATPDEVASAERRASGLATRMRVAGRALAGSVAPNFTPRPGLTLARLPRDPGFDRLEAAAREGEGNDLTFEQLPPFGRDGTTWVDEASLSLDPTFSASAFGLSRRGDVAGPIRSPFGLHVIVLLDRLPGLELTDDEIVRAFSDVVYGARARSALDRTLKELRAGTTIEFDPAVDEALGRVVAKGPQ